MSIGAVIDLVITFSAALNPPDPPGYCFAVALDIQLGTKFPKRRSQREDEGEMEALELRLKAELVI